MYVQRKPDLSATGSAAMVEWVEERASHESLRKSRSINVCIYVIFPSWMPKLIRTAEAFCTSSTSTVMMERGRARREGLARKSKRFTEKVKQRWETGHSERVKNGYRILDVHDSTMPTFMYSLVTSPMKQ